MLARSLEAARTVMRLPLFSSYSRHCLWLAGAGPRRGGASGTQWRSGAGGAGAALRGGLPSDLPAQVALPELAVGGAAGHCAQQVRVDLNDLLHRLRGCSGGGRSQW